ncbi:MAG TPA: LysR family transcriptional regulator [Burkholderiaceae bacterium]
MTTLDIDAVEAFVLVAELRSFTRAAEALDATQSSVSGRIRRLEDGLGRRLLERTPRQVRLSADGEAFLDSARELVAAHRRAMGAFDAPRRRLAVGISHHVVGAELPMVLQKMTLRASQVLIELRIGTSRDLFEAFERARLDAAIVLRHDNRRNDGQVLMNEAFAWLGTPDFVRPTGAPLPVALQAEPCSVRRMAVDALSLAGVAWSEVFVGGGVATTGAAAAAGLGVAVLARRVAPAGTVDVGPRLGLPPLPSRELVLHTCATDAPARAALRTLADALRSTTVAAA